MTTLANGFMALVGGFAIVAQTCLFTGMIGPA
jgi:hypothetical protein